MKNEECVAFLQWCLPHLGMRWAGFRKVRKTVCKRMTRRIRTLGLKDADAYRSYLATHQDEWSRLDAMCRIPISRFWRDRGVFDRLAVDVFPALARAAVARSDNILRVWSAGCASGEEPYSLRLAWSLNAEAEFPDVSISILATDIDDTMLARARAGLYGKGSLKDLPNGMIGQAFKHSDDLFEIRRRFSKDVLFLQQDIRTTMPDGIFDIILCRNLAFTYFEKTRQTDLLAKICSRLRRGGALVIGAHETLPFSEARLVEWDGASPIYRHCDFGSDCDRQSRS